MITWYDIKLKTLQKMFSTNNGSTTIPTDNATREYLSSMPGAANEALQMLATAGKFIIKTINIAHIPVRNLLLNTSNIKSLESGVIEYSAEKARSMYYEIKGKGTITLTVGESEPIVTEFDSKTTSQLGYMPIKQLISNPNNALVKISFASDYPFSLRNVAMYTATYETADEIPPYSEYIRYYLPNLADDFYMVDAEEVIYEGDETVKYTATSDFFQEGFKVLLLRRDKPGNYKIHYKSYPQTITNDTPDDTVLSLDPEVAALLPLYMASQLFKEDDNGLATSYRNEFEVAYERLVKNVNAPSSEKFKSVSGWI
jgi:hypothetical protein